jgi:DNA-binding NarL/FixJ family response regulator
MAGWSTRCFRGHDARGFLLKDAGPELLTQAVHAAANGEALIAPSVTVRLLAAFADLPTSEPLRQPIEPLTVREEEVMVTVARGPTNAEIATELHISLSPSRPTWPAS